MVTLPFVAQLYSPPLPEYVWVVPLPCHTPTNVSSRVSHTQPRQSSPSGSTHWLSRPFGGLSGWRLPAVMELLTVVDFTRTLPAIDPTAFPNALTGVFWTSSPYAFLSGNAWLVDFNYGDWDNIGVGNGDAARCVRGSRCYPTSRFVVLAGGLVQDRLTGLVWQQDGAGTRTGCSGSGTLTCTWAEAQAYCAGLILGGLSGWRLPTVKELSSLVDFAVGLGPSINQTAFPNTTLPSSFWTSSPSAFLSGAALAVNSVGGNSGFNDVGDDNGVRCVR